MRLDLTKLRPCLFPDGQTLLLPMCPGDSVWTIEEDYDESRHIVKYQVASLIISLTDISIITSTGETLRNFYTTKPEAQRALDKYNNECNQQGGLLK